MVGTSFIMGIIALVLSYVIGLPVGVAMAKHKDKLVDKLGMVYIIFIIAVPSLAYIYLFRYIGTQDYVKFAKAKGLNKSEIFRKHIFKNAVIPIAHGIPTALAGCITGAIITEAVYSVGGMGKMIPDSINKYNNAMIIALVFMFAGISVLSVLLGDIVLTKVDPRISLSEKAGRS